MRRNVYEVFEDFSKAKTKDEKIQVLAKDWSITLKTVLQLAFRPEFQWHFNSFPADYKKPDAPPGMSYATLDTELRRLYLFQVGNPTAEKLTPRKREELLIQLLESLEPKEAEVVIGIFKKDLNVKGLTHKFIRDNIPDIL